jgi:hypothetical protein
MNGPRVTFLGAAGTATGGGGGAMTPRLLAAERVLALWGFLLNLAWEAGQTPLYEDAGRGLAYLAWTRLHCTAGDVLILLGAFWLTSLAFRGRRWFVRSGLLAPGLFVVLGVAYTAWSEWANTSLRDAWQYRPLMPTLFGIGLAPLLQWLVIPSILVLLLRRSPRLNQPVGEPRRPTP